MKIWVLGCMVVVGCGAVTLESRAGILQSRKLEPAALTQEELKSHLEWISSHGPVQAPGNGRAPATQAGMDLSSVSPEYFTLVHEILAIRKAEEIDALIAKLETSYDHLDPNSKWIALHLIGIKNLRGIVFKAAPIYQKNHPVLSFALRQLKSAQEEILIQCPGAHCQAFADFVLYPKSVPVDRFFEVSQLLDFSVRTLVPDMRLMGERLRDLASRASANPILADLRLLRGGDAMADNKSGALSPYQRVVTSAAINSEIAEIFEWGIHGILFADSYDLNTLPELYASLGKLYGLDGFFLDPTDGVTTQDRVKVLRQSKFAKLFTIRQGAGPSVQAAFAYLKSGTEFWTLALTQMKAQLDSGTKIEGSILRPELFWAAPDRTELAAKNQKDLVNGLTSLRSMVSGEVVQVNLPKLYSNPPQDFKSFLPTSFDADPVKSDFKLPDGSVIKKSWNLPAGRAAAWSDAQFNAYFPDSSRGRSPRDLVRILRESMGGEVIASVLSEAVY